MKTWIVRVSRIGLTLAVTTSPATVSAGGWFSRRVDCAATAYGPCARQEYTQAFQHARQLDGLDCARLTTYAESVRATMNGQALATHRQPLVGAGAASSSVPLPSIEDPLISPLTPPAESSPPVFAPEPPKTETTPKPAKEAAPDAPK